MLNNANRTWRLALRTAALRRGPSTLPAGLLRYTAAASRQLFRVVLAHKEG